MDVFRCSTGEAWPDIMMSAVSGRPCDGRAHSWNYTEYGELYITDPEKRCGSIITYVYFISFIFLCSFIMLNIVVAVITDRNPIHPAGAPFCCSQTALCAPDYPP